MARFDEMMAAAGQSWDAAKDLGEALGRVGGAAYEDSTVDTALDAYGITEDAPPGYYATPHTQPEGLGEAMYDEYGNPTQAAGVGPGGAITVPGVGEVGVTVTAASGAPVGPAQAAVAIVQLVLSQPQILNAIKSRLGAVMRPAPTHSGGQAMTPFALKLMLSLMDDDYLMPIAQYLAGLEAPLGLSKKQQEMYLAIMVTDAMSDLGIFPDIQF